MDITEDVIVDLLPVYFSGEASAGTKTLVDDFLARDPVFAERVRREWAEPLGTQASVAPVMPSVELRSLHRTRRMLGLQRWVFALAIAFTVMPLSVVIPIDDGRPTGFHFLMRDYPSAPLPLLVAGAVCWCLYAGLRRRLRVD